MKKQDTQKPFRPANGTEGEMFMERNCYRCKHDDMENEVYCNILNSALLGKTPEEWTAASVMDPSTWECSAFERKE